MRWSLRIVPALLLAAVAAGCSRSGDGTPGGTLGVQLVYPSPPVASPGLSQATPRAPNYPTHPSDRILIRVLAPHFAPVERWFDRSAGRGEIEGIPAGARITVEVDEYDNTAVTLGTRAPLLGRGWHNGIDLSPGEVKTVPVPMYPKGTIVTVCGAPPVSGSGTPGDTGDGGLATEALLGEPVAVKAGPDDAIYISSLRYGRIRKIDQYGYIYNFGGSLTHGLISNGVTIDNAMTGPLFDMDFDVFGDLYLINQWQEIIKINMVDRSVLKLYSSNILLLNSNPNLSVVNLDYVYYVNGLDDHVYFVSNGLRDNFIVGGNPANIYDNVSRANYISSFPNGITFSKSSNSLVFCDTNNNMIKSVSFFTDYVSTMVGSQIYLPFAEGIDPLFMTPLKPKVVDYNPATGKIFFVEQGTDRVLFIDAQGKVRVFAGTGAVGFSGDGGPATAAQLNDPRAITVDTRGNAYIADFGNHAIRMVVGGALP